MDEPIKVWTGWVRRSQLGPEGLCGNRAEHPAHLHDSPSLGRFWCTADQSQREPGRSERRLGRVSEIVISPAVYPAPRPYREWKVARPPQEPPMSVGR